MSIKKEFKVNGLTVAVSMCEHSQLSCVQGKVYPFLDRFSSVAFEAKINPRDNECITSISLGGNTHSGINADRMAAAVTLANDTAKHYIGLMTDLQDAQTATEAIIRAVGANDLEQALDYVVLLSSSDMHLPESCNHNYRAPVKSATVFDAVVRSKEFKSLLDAVESELSGNHGGDTVSEKEQVMLALFHKAKTHKEHSFSCVDIPKMIIALHSIRENAEASVTKIEAFNI